MVHTTNDVMLHQCLVCSKLKFTSSNSSCCFQYVAGLSLSSPLLFCVSDFGKKIHSLYVQHKQRCALCVCAMASVVHSEIDKVFIFNPIGNFEFGILPKISLVTGILEIFKLNIVIRIKMSLTFNTICVWALNHNLKLTILFCINISHINPICHVTALKPTT